MRGMLLAGTNQQRMCTHVSNRELHISLQMCSQERWTENPGLFLSEEQLWCWLGEHTPPAFDPKFIFCGILPQCPDLWCYCCRGTVRINIKGKAESFSLGVLQLRAFLSLSILQPFLRIRPVFSFKVSNFLYIYLVVIMWQVIFPGRQSKR